MAPTRDTETERLRRYAVRPATSRRGK